MNLPVIWPPASFNSVAWLAIWVSFVALVSIFALYFLTLRCSLSLILVLFNCSDTLFDRLEFDLLIRVLEFNEERGPAARLLREWDLFLFDLTDFVPEKVASLETDFSLERERLFWFPIDYEKHDFVGVTMRS